MILEGGVRHCGKLRARRVAMRDEHDFEFSDQTAELARIEYEIKAVTQKARRLADELGARYAVFRCEVQRYDDGSDIRGAYIMRLSRQTDECIKSIYDLEQRRKQLLQMIGK